MGPAPGPRLWSLTLQPGWTDAPRAHQPEEAEAKRKHRPGRKFGRRHRRYGAVDRNVDRRAAANPGHFREISPGLERIGRHGRALPAEEVDKRRTFDLRAERLERRHGRGGHEVVERQLAAPDLLSADRAVGDGQSDGFPDRQGELEELGEPDAAAGSVLSGKRKALVEDRADIIDGDLCRRVRRRKR